MRFVNQAGSRVLDNPKDTLTETAVTAAMDQVIAKKISPIVVLASRGKKS